MQLATETGGVVFGPVVYTRFGPAFAADQKHKISMKAALQNFYQEMIAGSRLEIAAGGGPLDAMEAGPDQIRPCTPQRWPDGLETSLLGADAGTKSLGLAAPRAALPLLPIT